MHCFHVFLYKLSSHVFVQEETGRFLVNVKENLRKCLEIIEEKLTENLKKKTLKTPMFEYFSFLSMHFCFVSDWDCVV